MIEPLVLNSIKTTPSGQSGVPVPMPMFSNQPDDAPC